MQRHAAQSGARSCCCGSGCCGRCALCATPGRRRMGCGRMRSRRLRVCCCAMAGAAMSFRQMRLCGSCVTQRVRRIQRHGGVHKTREPENNYVCHPNTRQLHQNIGPFINRISCFTSTRRWRTCCKSTALSIVYCADLHYRASRRFEHYAIHLERRSDSNHRFVITLMIGNPIIAQLIPVKENFQFRT